MLWNMMYCNKEWKSLWKLVSTEYEINIAMVIKINIIGSINEILKRSKIYASEDSLVRLKCLKRWKEYVCLLEANFELIK